MYERFAIYIKLFSSLQTKLIIFGLIRENSGKFEKTIRTMSLHPGRLQFTINEDYQFAKVSLFYSEYTRYLDKFFRFYSPTSFILRSKGDDRGIHICGTQDCTTASHAIN